MSFGDQLYMDQLAEDISTGKKNVVEALTDAFEAGYEEAETALTGECDGGCDAYSDGFEDGLTQGYDDGYADGQDDA